MDLLKKDTTGGRKKGQIVWKEKGTSPLGRGGEKAKDKKGEAGGPNGFKWYYVRERRKTRKG